MPKIPRKVEYRDVPGFPGYRVGNDGTVWTCYMPRGGSMIGGGGRGGMKRGTTWKERKQGRAGGNDAWRVSLCRDGKVVSRFVHQLVLEAFVGPCPPGMVCRHGPKGKHCNDLDNLQWGTQKENIADKERDGTKVFGVRHHEAKMTPETVRAAREEHVQGANPFWLSKKYGVANATMRSILQRRTWKEVI